MGGRRTGCGRPAFATSADAFTWLDEHRPHLVGISRTPDVPAELLMRLSIGLFVLYLSRGYWLDRSQVSRAALGASSTVTDHSGKAKTDKAGTTEAKTTDFAYL